MMDNFADLIKAAVPMQDAVEFYVPGMRMKHKRIPCPLHHGTDYNFQVYDTSYYCFVCHETGDVITFVQKLLGLSFTDALEQLNNDFNLHLPIKRKATLGERRQLNARTAEFNQKRDEAARIRAKRDELMAKFVEYRKALFTEDPFSDHYAEAAKNIDFVHYQLDCIDSR